jgi:hypothetical protein
METVIKTVYVKYFFNNKNTLKPLHVISDFGSAEALILLTEDWRDGSWAILRDLCHNHHLVLRWPASAADLQRTTMNRNELTKEYNVKIQVVNK